MENAGLENHAGWKIDRIERKAVGERHLMPGPAIFSNF